jgi:hypothetical protein
VPFQNLLHHRFDSTFLNLYPSKADTAPCSYVD